MSEDIDEARSWLDRPIGAEELQALLEAIKAALDAHDGPLFPDGVRWLLEGDSAAP